MGGECANQRVMFAQHDQWSRCSSDGHNDDDDDDGDGDDDDGDDDDGGDDGEITTNNHAALPTVTFTSSDIFHRNPDKDQVWTRRGQRLKKSEDPDQTTPD